MPIDKRPRAFWLLDLEVPAFAGRLAPECTARSAFEESCLPRKARSFAGTGRCAWGATKADVPNHRRGLSAGIHGCRKLARCAGLDAVNQACFLPLNAGHPGRLFLAKTPPRDTRTGPAIETLLKPGEGHFGIASRHALALSAGRLPRRLRRPFLQLRHEYEELTVNVATWLPLHQRCREAGEA